MWAIFDKTFDKEEDLMIIIIIFSKLKNMEHVIL